MVEPAWIPLPSARDFSAADSCQKSADFFAMMQQRRTVREFSNQPVPRVVIENCVRTAGTAPSGANLQPWHFAIVSNPEIKRQIREGAEQEEREFYKSAPQEWLKALEPLGTDDQKPFLEVAPYLIVIFLQRFGLNPDGEKTKNYYAAESVGIATGMLITAIHQAGLVSLTHTPAPMKFLSGILNRPENERPYLILAVGRPAEDVRVPDIQRKSFHEISSEH